MVQMNYAANRIRPAGSATGPACGTSTVTPHSGPGRNPRPLPKGQNMLGIIALVLVVLWLLGFFAFHVTTAAIHIILVIAVILVVLHFVRGRSV